MRELAIAWFCRGAKVRLSGFSGIWTPSKTQPKEKMYFFIRLGLRDRHMVWEPLENRPDVLSDARFYGKPIKKKTFLNQKNFPQK